MEPIDVKQKAIDLANKFFTKSVFDLTNEELKEERVLAVKLALVSVSTMIEENEFNRENWFTSTHSCEWDNIQEDLGRVRQELFKL